MNTVIILTALLAGWAVRKKAAEIHKIRKTNQSHRRTLRRNKRQASCWEQVQAVSSDYVEGAVICR